LKQLPGNSNNWIPESVEEALLHSENKEKIHELANWMTPTDAVI
jgi:hypothetical protein